MAFTKLCNRRNSKGERIYFIRYYLTRGKERRFTIGNVSPRRAKEITERIRSMVIQGVDPQEFYKEQAEKNDDVQRLKLAELVEAYLKYCEISNRPSTIDLKKDAYNSFRDFLGNCYADKITPEKIESWMTNLKVSKTSVNIKLRAVKAMFNWGAKRGLLQDNPFANSGIQQYKVPDSDPEGYFTLKEIRLILNNLKSLDEQLWRLVFLALETGGRLSELNALTSDDIDMKNGRVLFRGPTTKTGQRRHVPLREKAVEEIQSWGIEKSKNLFHWQYPSNASKRFRALLGGLNLRKTRSSTRSFHTLRHTYASHLLMNSVNIFTVSRWLGHSSVRVTEKHYGHLIPDTVEVKLEW